MNLSRRQAAIVASLALATALAVPLAADGYLIYLLTQACLYAVLAISLDLIWGYGGILDLGHSMWFGTGALVVGMLTTTVSPTGLITSTSADPMTFVVAIALGTVAAAALAAVVCWFACASSDSSPFYLSIVTLALATALQTIYTQFPAIGGGENGLFGFALAPLAGLPGYYLAVIVLALVLAGAMVVVRSDFGLLMCAVRDHEQRARYLGYDVRATKVLIFAAGAGVAGFAGALFGAMFGFVSAPLFGFLFSTEILIWVALGGRATIVGPALGAILLGVLGPRLNERWPFQWPLLMGALFVCVVVFAPAGLLSPIVRLASRARRAFGGVANDAVGRAGGRTLQAAPASERRAQAPGDVPVINLSEVRFAYGALQVLRGIDLSIRRGELLCIVGPNGAGKSTLLNLLTDGRLGHTGGVELKLTGDPRHDQAPPHRLVRAGLGRKFQTPALFPTLSLAETLILATRRGRWPSVWRRTTAVAVPGSVVRICEAAGLIDHVDRPAGELAHGLKQGLELATAVAARPEVLLLDEPTAGLVAGERELIGGILTHLVRNAGITVVLIEHDLDFVLRIADRIAVLDDGRIVECGAPDVVAQSTAVRGAYLGAGH